MLCCVSLPGVLAPHHKYENAYNDDVHAVGGEDDVANPQVVKMMMGVVSIFLVCWLPYHTYFIIANLYPAINYSHYIQVIIILRIITAIKNISHSLHFKTHLNIRNPRHRICPIIKIYLHGDLEGDILVHLLAGNVQLDVQSHDLLLHEPEVVQAFHDNLVVLSF